MWKLKSRKRYPKSEKGKYRPKLVPKERQNKLETSLFSLYKAGFNTKRSIYELLLPMLLSFLVTIFPAFFLSEDSIDILLRINDLNLMLFTVIAVFVGFNITSVSLIASFNKEDLQNAFSKISIHQERIQALKKLIASFVYSIVLQIIIIIVGIIYSLGFKELSLLFGFLKVPYQILNIGYFLWLSIIIHSLIICLRNVNLLYKFLLIKLMK